MTFWFYLGYAVHEKESFDLTVVVQFFVENTSHLDNQYLVLEVNESHLSQLALVHLVVVVDEKMIVEDMVDELVGVLQVVDQTDGSFEKRVDKHVVVDS